MFMATHTQHRALVLAGLVALAGSQVNGKAKEIPPFDLHTRTEQAVLVVHGRLDERGNLTVESALKAKPGAGPLIVTNGASVCAALSKAAKQPAPIEVVVYLTRADAGRWQIDTGETGVVGFIGNGAYLVHEEGGIRQGGPVLSRHPTLLRGPFLESARKAVAAVERRKELLRLPPSAARLEQIVRFVQTQPASGQRHHLYLATRALQPLHSAEEKALVALLKNPDRSLDVPLLLDLAGATARGAAMFAVVADHLDRRQVKTVRLSAMRALAAIDPYQAQERLVPLLRIEEEELADVLQCLYQGESFHLHPAVVEPLRKLTEAVRRQQRLDRHALSQESYVLAGILGHYSHPRLLPGLVEWVQANDHVSANQAESYLRAWTGLNLREDPRGWEAWWKKAKPELEATYDLSTPAGRKKWYDAYRAGDANLRQVLLRLWAFEPTVAEPSLVREASGESGESARVVLATLWKHRRLSGQAKEALVEKFLRVRLEEVPNQPAGPRRELHIVGEKGFPFPAEAWVHWRASIVIGDRKPMLDESFNISSLGQETELQKLGSLGSGPHPGTPEARALLELREVDHEQVVWKHQWTLGPIRLRQAK
jgi:hypothetical protein